MSTDVACAVPAPDPSRPPRDRQASRLPGLLVLGLTVLGAWLAAAPSWAHERFVSAPKADAVASHARSASIAEHEPAQAGERFVGLIAPRTVA